MIQKLFSIFTSSTQDFEGKEVGEEVILVVRRHYFTILTPLSLIALAALIPIIVLETFSIETSAFASLFSFATSLFYLFLWIVTFYILTLYLLNTVIVTNKRIVENEQYAFFSRKVSELHIYRVQDVAVRTHGLIETLLSFGEIAVQTAAQEREFVFTKIPHPERVKDVIMKHVVSHRSNLKLH